MLRRPYSFTKNACILCGMEDDEPDVFGEKVTAYFITVHQNCVVSSDLND